MGCDCQPHGQGIRPGSIKRLACAQPEPKVKLETVILQSQLGTDEEGQPYAPKFGKYTNTVVKYLANDAIYIYDASGQFTLFSKHGEVVEGDDGYINGDQLFQIKEALEEMDRQLQEKDAELEQAIETETQEREEAIENLEAELDDEAQIREEEDTNLQSQIDAMAAATDVIDVVDTYADLRGYNTQNVHLNDIIKVLNDETHEGAITYYRWDGSQWDYVGSTGPYYTKAEADEKFATQESVDTEKLDSLADIKTIGENLELTEDGTLNGKGGEVPERAKNLPQYVVATTDLASPSTRDVLNEWYRYADYVTPSIRTINLDTGGTGGRGQAALYAATHDSAGVMSAADKRNLDALVEGGGAGGGKLYSEYGDNEDGALTQKFITEKLNGLAVKLGYNASAGGGSGAIGQGARSSGANAFAVGFDASVSGMYGLAAATDARASGDCAIAIGYKANANLPSSVAIGDNTTVTRNGEVSIGGGGTYSARYLSNVHAGELDTDAVNLKQMQDYVAEHGGGGGGGSTPIAEAYGDSSTTALSQKFLSEKLNGEGIVLGANAKNVSPTDVIIGNAAKRQGGGSAYGAVVIGSAASTSGADGYQVALGYNAGASATGAVAVGSDAKAEHSNSVVLGHNSYSGRENEVSIGNDFGSGYLPNTRFLANIKAGELDTDAVNKKQMEDYVAEHAGGGGGGTLYSAYGQNTDGALTQKFVSDKLNGGSVVIGQSASANNTGVAIGTTANAVNSYSVALGYQSKTNRQYEVSIGQSGATKYLANVKDGELDTDAVTVKQLKDAIAALRAELNLD